MFELTNEEIRRYSRHLILPEVGLAGQRKIRNTSVLCIGAGGLGSPIAMYLAAAGIGRLGIVDFDTVDYSNLQRQILHSDADVGTSKADSAKAATAALSTAGSTGCRSRCASMKPCSFSSDTGLG